MIWRSGKVNMRTEVTGHTGHTYKPPEWSVVVLVTRYTYDIITFRRWKKKKRKIQ